MFPRSPSLTIGEELSISERKILFGLISNNQSLPQKEEAVYRQVYIVSYRVLKRARAMI